MNKKNNLFLAQQEIAPCQTSTDFSVYDGEHAACGAKANEARAAEPKNVADTESAKPEYGIQNMKFQKTNDEIQNSEFKKTNDRIQNSEFKKTNDEIQNPEFKKIKDGIQNPEFKKTNDGIQNSEFKKTKDEIQNSEFAKSNPETSNANLSKPPFRLKSFLTTRQIAYFAVFTALLIVVNGASVSSQTSSISFTYVAAFFAGATLGPVGGFLAGFLGDYIGCLLVPKGPYIIFIGLSSGLMGLIPGVIMNLKILERLYSRLSPVGERLLKTAAILVAMALIAALCTMCLNTLGLFLTYSSKAHTFANWLAYMASRSLQFPVIIVNAVIIIFTFHALENDLKKIRAKLKRKN